MGKFQRKSWSSTSKFR